MVKLLVPFSDLVNSGELFHFLFHTDDIWRFSKELPVDFTRIIIRT